MAYTKAELLKEYGNKDEEKKRSKRNTKLLFIIFK